MRRFEIYLPAIVHVRFPISADTRGEAIAEAIKKFQPDMIGQLGPEAAYDMLGPTAIVQEFYASGGSWFLTVPLPEEERPPLVVMPLAAPAIAEEAWEG